VKTHPMERMGAGFLLLIAAGVTILISAMLPWGQLSQPAVTFTALQMHLYTPFAFDIITGLTLIGFALARTMWAGFVGISAAFVAAITVLMIDGNIYVGLHAVAPTLALGEVTHVTGFGVAVLFAGGLMAGFAGAVTAIQTAPEVITSPRQHQS
jgi:hypothetical protein